MFEVVPPGMQPIRIRPTVSPGDRSSACASKKASSGMMPYWHSRPTSTPLGLRKAMRKSRQVSDAPMPSMMTIIMMPSSLVSNSEIMSEFSLSG
jgi:hypothetical protein